MSRSTVYMDYAATTPVDPRVATAMAQCLTLEGAFGNPSSLHAPGIAARERVEQARAQVAVLIGAEAASIIWTSGATEANNLAILGSARFYADRGRHIVTARTEHKAVLDPCKQLEKEGCKVTYLKPDAGGVVSAEQVAAALTPATVLVSLMQVNNETGVTTDVAAIGRVCREHGVSFHVDAAQSAGKLAIDVEAQCIDLLSLSAHKLYGPKGIGALYVRRKPPLGLVPLMFGGGHEGGVRPGTLPTHQIVGMGLACEIAVAERESEARRLKPLRDRLWHGLQTLGSVHLNGAVDVLQTQQTLQDPHPNPLPFPLSQGKRGLGEQGEGGSNVPHILNVSFEGVEGESLLAGLEGLAVSSGAACSSASQEASYVLRALGRSDALAQASLRFSLGRFSTEADIDRALEVVRAQITHLRRLSPATEPLLSGDGVIHGEAGSIEQGAWVRLSVRIADRQVTEARFNAYGCPDTTAAAEWLAARLLGRTIDRLFPEGAREMATLLQIPAEKLGRLLVIEDALRRIEALWPSR